MILGTYLKENENLKTEYKEFCFKLNLKKYYDVKSIRQIITQGIFDDFLNNLVLKNVELYLAKYVPRYLSSFHNTKVSKKSVLYFGVDDFNEITGIPYNGNLIEYKAYFENTIQNIIEKSISNTCCTKCKLSIFENEINEDILNDYDIQTILRKCTEEKLLFDKEYNNYKQNKQKWIIEMYKYKGKLEDLMNDQTTRLEFVHFLESKNLLTFFKNILLIKKFEIDVSDIKYCKKNTNSYIYWLLAFKDEKVRTLIKMKPKEPIMPKILNVELNILTQLKCLRNIFVNNNVRYFTIKIEIFSNPKCNNDISYTDLKTFNKRTIKRIHKDCGPACSNL